METSPEVQYGGVTLYDALPVEIIERETGQLRMAVGGFRRSLRLAAAPRVHILPEEQGEGGLEGGGVREPRKPLPPHDVASVALQLPLELLDTQAIAN